MVSVSKIETTNRFSPNFIYVSFQINNTYEKLSDYQFDVLRSSSSKDEFELIAVDVKNFECLDFSAILTNPTIKYYYKIRIIDKISGEVSESDAEKIALNNDDNYVFFMNHVNNMYLKDILKNDALLIKKRRFGEYCECYDDVREKSTKQNCTSCYGTKFKHGYYSPVSINIGYHNSPVQTEKLDMKGVTQTESPIQIWTTSYPLITQGDIILMPDNSRYRVITWNDSDKHLNSLRQTLQIQKIPHTDVVYKLHIEEGEFHE